MQRLQEQDNDARQAINRQGQQQQRTGRVPQTGEREASTREPSAHGGARRQRGDQLWSKLDRGMPGAAATRQRSKDQYASLIGNQPCTADNQSSDEIDAVLRQQPSLEPMRRHVSGSMMVVRWMQLYEYVLCITGHDTTLTGHAYATLNRVLGK